MIIPSILLIDPFKNLINAYQIILREEGYSVESAFNLEEANSYLREKKYFIIIVEYLYPYEVTEEFIRRVKQTTPETYVIMIANAIIDSETYERLFETGLDEFILKPYSPDKILVHIKKGLKQRELILHLNELKRLNLVDPISEELNRLIFNKNYFQTSLQKELKRSKRHQHPFSILLIKVMVNKIEKHLLNGFHKEFLDLIRKNTREEDVVSKNNGEIGLLLPETNRAGCQALQQRLEGLIKQYPPFRSERLEEIMKSLSFQSFTFPEQSDMLESLRF